MRKIVALAAIAPMALLAACGDSTPVEEVEPETMEAVDVAEPAAANDDMPPAVPNSLDEVDFAGTYGMTGLDGSVSTITLDPESDAYEYTAGDGTTSSGSYSRMDDGSRILIDDFDGRAGYFTIADGAIYRLPDADTAYDEITVTGMYERQDEVMQGSPDATTASTQDKRQ